MEKVMNVSEIRRDNPNKYGKYARSKIEVDYMKDGNLQKREDYLDEKQAMIDVNNYISNLKNARSNLHLKYLNKRVIYNGIMALLCVSEFFLILGLGNLAISLGTSSLLTSIIANISIPLVVGASLWYVNQRKFYYSNNEIDMLEQIKKELNKSDNILSEIYKIKQEGKMFEYDYQRLNKDYEKTRERNRDRNIKMQLEGNKRNKEINYRIDKKVEAMKKNNHFVNNINFDYFVDTYNTSKKIHRNSTFREIKQDIKEVILEEINKKEQAKYFDNSFERGQRRR